MSWASHFSNLGRFSPFTRSPPKGSTQVSDADFSYITADDLKQHQEGEPPPSYHALSPKVESSIGKEPPRDTDMLILRKKKKEYQVHFPAYSIAKGELMVGAVRDMAAKKINTSDVQRIKLLYKGKNLKYDERSCKAEGLEVGSEIMVTVGEKSSTSGNGSDQEKDETVDGMAEREANSSEIQRKKEKEKSQTQRQSVKRDPSAAQGSGMSTPDRTSTGASLSMASKPDAASNPPAPGTPKYKLNVLRDLLRKLSPDCKTFMQNPPKNGKDKKNEYLRLTVTISDKVIGEVDDVPRDPHVQKERRELITESQKVLAGLDAVMTDEVTESVDDIMGDLNVQKNRRKLIKEALEVLVNL